LPTTGTLKYDGTAISQTQATAGFPVSAGNIGLLTFVPNADVTAQGTFQFKVTDQNDGLTSPSAGTMSLNVTADGGPIAGASSVTFTEDHTYTFKATDFVYSDSADASTDSLASITIVTLPSSGTLKLGINNVTAG